MAIKSPIDQTGHEQDLPGVTQGEDKEVDRLQLRERLARTLATIVPIATGNLVPGPESDQDTGRHTCSRPERRDGEHDWPSRPR